MSAFTQKQLEGLQEQYNTNKRIMLDAAREMDAAGNDQYSYGAAAERYAIAENANICLENSYYMAEQRAAQAQSVPQPMSDGEALQRAVYRRSTRPA